jgi:hypothetical protein
MKKRIELGLFALVLMACVAVGPAQAQDTGKVSILVGYSYQLNNLGNDLMAPNLCVFSSNCVPTELGQQGYSFAATYNFNKNIGLEANFTGHNGGANVFSFPASSANNGDLERQTQDLYTYTFGPKVTLPVGNFSLFSHFLVGGMHSHIGDTETCIPSTGGGATCSSTVLFSANANGSGMAFKTGGGLDWNHGRWGIRILEVDYVHGAVSITGTCSSCFGTPDTIPTWANNFQLATGLTFNFK